MILFQLIYFSSFSRTSSLISIIFSFIRISYVLICAPQFAQARVLLFVLTFVSSPCVPEQHWIFAANELFLFELMHIELFMDHTMVQWELTKSQYNLYRFLFFALLVSLIISTWADFTYLYIIYKFHANCSTASEMCQYIDYDSPG